MTQLGMVIDLKKCFGCQTCATSCKTANNLPVGVWWNTVYTRGGGTTIDTAGGTYEQPVMYHQPVSCQHCSSPICVQVCPSGATWKDEETGIVMQDSTICIGCQNCINACPYDVRRYIEGDPAWTVDFPVGYADAPVHSPNAVGKCTFCANLIKEGKNPMCVDACIGFARTCGDLDDPESAVSQLLNSGREVQQLLVEEGTSPNVFYLM